MRKVDTRSNPALRFVGLVLGNALIWFFIKDAAFFAAVPDLLIGGVLLAAAIGAMFWRPAVVWQRRALNGISIICNRVLYPIFNLMLVLEFSARGIDRSGLAKFGGIGPMSGVIHLIMRESIFWGLIGRGLNALDKGHTDDAFEAHEVFYFD